MVPFVPKHSPCMEKLDKLPWTTGFSFMAYGMKMGFRTTKAEVLPLVQSLVPPGSQPLDVEEVQQLASFQVGGRDPKGRARQFHLVYAGVGRTARTHDIDEALHAVESSLQLLLAAYSTAYTFLHAGVVAWRGKAILIPARSFAGKSTLVAELLRAGAEYYSDEYALVDEQGLVHPYPRRLSLRNGDTVPRVRCTAEDLGSRTGHDPIPVGLVALSKFKPGAAWEPRKVSASKAALALLDNAVAIRRYPEQCVSAVERVVASSRCVSSRRGEASEMAERLLASCA